MEGKDMCCWKLPIGEISGKRPEGYDDIFVFVPEMRQIIRIAEGNGSNLLQISTAVWKNAYRMYWIWHMEAWLDS